MRSKINKTGGIQVGSGQTSNTELQGITEEFLKHLESKKQSPLTVKKRRDDMRRFLLYLEQREIRRFTDADLQTLHDFRKCLVDHDYSPSSITSTMQAVRGFFNFLSDRGDLFENPALRLKIQKPKPIMGVVLTQQEVNALLAAPDTSTRLGIRDRAILELLYSCALRRREVMSMKVHDVNLETATVRIPKGKGNKERLLPLGKQAVKFIRMYIKQVRPHYLPKISAAPDELWLCPLRRKITYTTIQWAIQKYREQAGIEKQVDTHTMRRTCATHMLRGGAHPVAVAELLGHSGLRSLAHYLHTNIQDLRNIHTQSKPGK